MKCDYFENCGSCSAEQADYHHQLTEKTHKLESQFRSFFKGPFETFESEKMHYRYRAEFKIYHTDASLSYAMYDRNKKLFSIDSCPIVSGPVHALMPKLIERITLSSDLKNRLFGIEFLSTTTDAVLVTLLYHRPLDEEWQQEAKTLEDAFGITVIGRSRKQKMILSNDSVIERFDIDGSTYAFHHYEGGFTQPNAAVNQKMIRWAMERTSESTGDLLELYCGLGNFTIPLSRNFRNVLATEVSKTSIHALNQNISLNGIQNLKCARLSSGELVQAFHKTRTFRRLTQQHIELDSYDFQTVFVDPPRAGLDDETREFISRFPGILYISCNPRTLERDLKTLTRTHTVTHFAFFDQFPYTPHMECGCYLTKR